MGDGMLRIEHSPKHKPEEGGEEGYHRNAGKESWLVCLDNNLHAENKSQDYFPQTLNLQRG